MKQSILYFILICIPLKGMGQMSFYEDTIRISEVIISSKKSGQETSGYRDLKIDSAIIKRYSHSSLSEVLSSYSGIFIKDYGPGSISIPSFRGTGASHTQVLWNGVNINNPMLGQTDLSTIPSLASDEISIMYGAASITSGSGGIGGAILLNTTPLWRKGTSVFLNAGTGSFGKYTGSFKVVSSSDKLQTNTSLYFHQAENDFTYINNTDNSEPVSEIRKNSQVSQKGFIQELFLRKNSNVFSGRIWYQLTDRNIPAPIISSQNNAGESQTDESLMAIADYSIETIGADYNISASWLLNRLDYLNKEADIDSRNLAQTLTFKANVSKKMLNGFCFDLNAGSDLSSVQSNNYLGYKSRNIFTITSSLKRIWAEKLDTKILVREIIHNSSFLMPDFSSALQYRIFHDREYFIKANFSRNSRIPTLNELYWNPGGNTELKNEYAYLYELSYCMNEQISSKVSLEADMALFQNNIRDMIQWVPGKYSYWTAENVQNAITRGVESMLVLKIKTGNINYRIDAGYSYTQANNVQQPENEKYQLIYVPEHQANGSLSVKYKQFYSSWNSSFTGIRYTTVDNSDFLPAYLINSISAGAGLKFRSVVADISLIIDNIFNVSYQTIAYYPLPGRSYFMKLTFNLNLIKE